MFFSSYPINSQLEQEDHSDLILTQNQPQLFPNFDPDNFSDPLAIQLLPNNSIRSVPQPPLPPSNLEIKPASAAATTDLVGPSNGGRKRTMKDRHSKIVTAKGPRDRRMRLSLEVAKKFFDLQDLLGFDKASKTVEWLLTKSRHAMRSLTSCGRSIIKRNRRNGSNPKMEPSISDCEEEEGEEEEVVAVENEVVGAPAKTSASRSSAARTQRKLLTKPKILKESRVEARARARERTMEKRLLMLGTTRFDQDIDLHCLNQQPNSIRSASSSFVECGEPSSSSSSIPLMMRMMMGSDENGGITSAFDYNCNNNNIFLNHVDPFNIYQENWNNFYPPSAAAIAEEQQNIINHNIHQRGWDAFNNQSSL